MVAEAAVVAAVGRKTAEEVEAVTAGVVTRQEVAEDRWSLMEVQTG